MSDGRGDNQTTLVAAGLDDQIVERALLIGEEHGSMRELSALLPSVGVPRITHMLDTSALESHLTGVLAIFVDSAVPTRVLQVARFVRRQLVRARVIAVGAPASPREMFEYGQGGVAAYLESPVERDALRACLAPPGRNGLGAIAQSLVGRIGLKEAQQELRVLMVSHAMRLCRGSRGSAARLLDVTRPAIQRVLREAEDLAPGTGPGPLDEQPR